jgi:hypothetical protein
VPDCPDIIDIVVEIIDGQIYVTHTVPNNISCAVMVCDYDTAEKVSIEAALAHKAEVQQGGLALSSVLGNWEEYLAERAVPILP